MFERSTKKFESLNEFKFEVQLKSLFATQVYHYRENLCATTVQRALENMRHAQFEAALSLKTLLTDLTATMHESEWKKRSRDSLLIEFPPKKRCIPCGFCIACSEAAFPKYFYPEEEWWKAIDKYNKEIRDARQRFCENKQQHEITDQRELRAEGALWGLQWGRSGVLQVADPVPRATSQNDDDDDASQTTFCSSRRRFVLHDDASQLQTQQALAEEHAQRMEETREIARRDPRWAAMLRRHPPGTMYILDADSRRRIDIVPNNQQDYFSFVYR